VYKPKSIEKQRLAIEEQKHFEDMKKFQQRLALDKWIAFEQITMHFNNMLMTLRTGGIAAIFTIFAASGITLRFVGSNGETNYFALSCITLGLLYVWILVWLLDHGYYNRLLSASIEVIKDFEKETQISNFSSEIEKKFEGTDTRTLFYCGSCLLLSGISIVCLFSHGKYNRMLPIVAFISFFSSTYFFLFSSSIFIKYLFKINCQISHRSLIYLTLIFLVFIGCIFFHFNSTVMDWIVC